MPYTTNMTGTTSVDDSILIAYDQGFLVAYGQDNVMDQFVEYREDIGAKSIELPRYTRLALATTPLTEDEDATSQALADTKIVFTPAEYGTVVTRTMLSSLQTGGKVDLAAAQLVGINASQTMDKLAVLALDAATNSRIIGGTAEGSVTSGQIMSTSEINAQYNRLARANVPMINGAYVAITHDDVLHDVRTNTSTGGFVDVTKYATPDASLRNEVGMFGGFRWVRNNQATFADQSGAGLVDIYSSYFLGFNSLGKATNAPLTMRFTGPFDKLGRFVNIGWHTSTQYKVVEQDAVQVLKTASSVGNNAA